MVRLDHCDRYALGTQRLEEARFVKLAVLCYPVQHGVSADGPCKVASNGSLFKACQVLAFEVTHEVRGGVDKVPINHLHGSILSRSESIRKHADTSNST